MPSSKFGACSVRFWVNPIEVSNHRRRAATLPTLPVRCHRPDHPLGLSHSRGQPYRPESQGVFEICRLGCSLPHSNVPSRQRLGVRRSFHELQPAVVQRPSSDRTCALQEIEHRLIPPRRPQTNGMVKRFNGGPAKPLLRFPSRAWNPPCAALSRFTTITFSSEPWDTSSRFRLSNTGKPHHFRLFHKEVYKQ